ncbi:MAG: N-acetylmuramoyl-L-alanine amidase [Firmicutes bacterium]|nr:N-acetylmuramoyl-L-alanine amidase [Bacillota bacterium]
MYKSSKRRVTSFHLWTVDMHHLRQIGQWYRSTKAGWVLRGGVLLALLFGFYLPFQQNLPSVAHPTATYLGLSSQAPQGGADVSPPSKDANPASAIAPQQHGDPSSVDGQASGAAPTLPQVQQSLLLEKMTILLDPGHGGSDTGAIAPDGTYEKDINLAIAQKAAKALQEMGAKVILTRNNDRDLAATAAQSLALRAAKAEQIHADLSLSIHCNTASDTQLHGPEIFVYPDDIHSVRLGVLLQMRLNPILDGHFTPENGSVLAMVRRPSMPSVLIETGFLSNATDRKNLESGAVQNRLAQAIAMGVADYVRGKGVPQEMLRTIHLSPYPPVP